MNTAGRLRTRAGFQRSAAIVARAPPCIDVTPEGVNQQSMVNLINGSDVSEYGG